MYVDVSQPPPALPQPDLKQISAGLSVLSPLSRRGTGPGIIVVVPNTTKSTSIENGVPSAAMKWAEEGYTVAEIQEEAFKSTSDAALVLGSAVTALNGSEKCEPKDKVGLIAYTPSLWTLVSDSIASVPAIAGAISYGEIANASSLDEKKPVVPQLHHLAGRTDDKLPRTPAFTLLEYAPMKSALFALPFQSEFHYAQEAVSHTRNLTFLKKLMDGPWFDLEDIWDEHTYFEFENRSVEWTMSTMVQEPYVNHIPTMTGGIGRENLSEFYANHFIFKNPADTELELTSRTVGIDRVIDEFIYKFTHDSEVDWLIPGVPVTNKRVEVPMTAVVNIRGDRLYHEHIAWDQGTVLRQLGLLPEYLPYPYGSAAEGKKVEYKVPAAGIETADKMREKNAVVSNGMFEFKMREV